MCCAEDEAEVQEFLFVGEKVLKVACAVLKVVFESRSVTSFRTVVHFAHELDKAIEGISVN